MDVDKYGGGTVASTIATHRCPYCTLMYGSLAGVATHLVRKHAGEPIPSLKTMALLTIGGHDA